MAGLYELQLPRQSRSRRSQDVPEPRLSISSGTRSNSPPPEVTAREIVNQVVAKREAAAAASVSSTSIFPWRRRATGQRSSRQSSDAPSRNSVDTSSRGDSQSPDRSKKYTDRLSPRRITGPVVPPSPTSPRVSSSIDFTLTPSSSDPAGITLGVSQEPNATSALAHAGLGIGFPPISFPDPPPPVSRPGSSKRKASARPITAHGHEGASTSTSSFKVDHVRRVRSFSKNEGVRGSSFENKPDKGDVLVLTRDRPLLVAPHANSMPEWPSRDIKGKGKARTPVSDTETTPIVENFSTRGRQSASPPTLAAADREQSISRRTSWWPGRRRIDSSPANPRLVNSRVPLPPPPIPQRSQARPSTVSGQTTPSLPSFRPFSPLMSDFQISASPSSVGSFEDHDTSKQRGPEVILNQGEGGVSIRRRHSLNNRTGGTQYYVTPISSQTPNRPPSQAYAQSHRYSWSIPLSSSMEHDPSSQPTHSPSAPSLSSSSNTIHDSKPPSVVPDVKSTRRRSMTVNSPPIPPPQPPTRETPLLLRHPINRPNSMVGPPDPFLSGWGVGSGTHTSLEIPEAESLVVLPVEMQRTPSTSSGSTSSLSHSTPATRSPGQRPSTIPPTRALTASSTSTSLPPPPSSNRLLRRLSSTLFSSISTPMASPVEHSQSMFNSTANLSTVRNSGAGTSSPTTSDASSPRWSKENLPVGEGSRISAEVMRSKLSKPPVRMLDESSEDYVRRLVEIVSKAEVAHVLAASGDAFHARALRSYIDRFDFLDDPLDVALRKLLMDLGLPRETQQIDRVMEAFAARYIRCNSGLFENDDHPYILAFSLIMLHTDAFNKSNKNKMTKADYVKNARLSGVPPEILECFFDNTVFAPFIFIEDPVDANAPKGYLPEGASRLSSINGLATNPSGGVMNSGGSTILGKANKIDPYYLITQGLLGPLRADVKAHIPWSNPFLFEGTDWPWDMRRLHLLFAVAQVVHVPGDPPPSPTLHSASITALATPMRRKSIALPSLGMGNGPFIGSSPFTLDGIPSPPRVSVSRSLGPGSIRIITAGVLARKEDLMESGKRSANRKWREWSVLLTGSQLLFFRDVNFASQLLGRPIADGALNTAPEVGLMNPDEAVSLHECVALYDITYSKYGNTFRFLMPTGRQFLCQAPNERSLNDWISTINYASAFKTAGVSIRGLGMSHKDVEMTGVAAATSHLQDLRTSSKSSVPTLVHTYEPPNATRSLEVSPSRPQSSGSSARIGSGSKLLRSFTGAQSQVDLELPVPSHLEGAYQLKATFDEVKAELAAHSTEQLPPASAGRVRTLSMGARPTVKTAPRPATTGASSRSDDMHHTTSRNDILQSFIDSWDSKIGRMQHELNSELRIARNLAILTPFQRATRDRIQLAVFPLAKKIKTMRIDLTKLTCYRFVLLSDLADEERHLEQAKRDALKAATQKLSTAEGLPGQAVQKENSDEQFGPTLHLRSPPSASESFYSALDGLEGSGNPSTPLSMLSEDDTTDFPFLPKIRTSTPRDRNATPTRSPSNPTASDITYPSVANGHERFYTAAETPEEIAEEWNETRAAKRVSLVRMPSDVKLSSAFGRQWNPDSVVRLRDDGQPATSSPRVGLTPSWR